MRRPVGLVIFDWDGTLARTLDLWVDGYVGALAGRGHVYEPADIARHFLTEHHRVEETHPHLDFPPIVAEARAHVLGQAMRVDLYDGAEDVLRALDRAGVALALVSSSPRDLLQRGLFAHQLAGCFGSVIAGDDGYGHKPDPLPFVETLRRMGTQAGDTLIIGDSTVDILAGQAAGCRTCWFAPEHNRLFHDFDRMAGLGADLRVSELAGLIAHVQGG